MSTTDMHGLGVRADVSTIKVGYLSKKRGWGLVSTVGAMLEMVPGRCKAIQGASSQRISSPVRSISDCTNLVIIRTIYSALDDIRGSIAGKCTCLIEENKREFTIRSLLRI